MIFAGEQVNAALIKALTSQAVALHGYLPRNRTLLKNRIEPFQKESLSAV